MDFVELTKRSNRDLYDACDRSALQKAGRAMDRAGGLKKLLLARDKSLDPFTGRQLTALSEVHRDNGRWKEAARELRRLMATSGINLPDGSLQKAADPHELSALGRAGRMSPRSAHQDHNGWAASVDAHIELWRACVSIGLSSGTLAIKMVGPDHAEADEFSSLVTANASFEEMKGYRWLSARRGEKAGILKIEIAYPEEELEDQAEARLDAMGLASQKRGARGVLEELVLDNLASALGAIMDARARREALRSAASAYAGLLEAPPLGEVPVLALHVGSSTAPVGLAVLDGKGEILARDEIPSGDDLQGRVSEAIANHSPASAVLPASATDQDRLDAATAALGDLPVTRVIPAAIKEARKDLDEGPMIASAVVLARRALRPDVEFAKVHPASLGLGEYTADLDRERLEEVLDEARMIVAWEKAQRAGGIKPRKKGPAPGRPGKAVKRLNPLVKTIRDLKPGMTLDGVITNLTRFGAFVNVGLSTEAMIHVSQLSTEFVEEPSEVVRVGQNVSARVIEVVPEKSRIALSLKSAPEPGERPSFREPRPDRGPSRQASAPSVSQRSASNHHDKPTQSGGKSGEGDKKSRSAALADLDALFKK